MVDDNTGIHASSYVSFEPAHTATSFAALPSVEIERPFFEIKVET